MHDLFFRCQAVYLASAFVLLLSACATGSSLIKPESQPPEIGRLSPGHDISDAASSNRTAVEVKWWTVWGDPQLTQLMESHALAAPTVAQAAATVRRSYAGLEGANAERSAAVNANGKAIGERFPDHSTYPSLYAGNWGSEGALGWSARYTIDFWGKRQEAQSAASARVDLALAEAEAAHLLLRTTLVDAYLRLDIAYHIREVAAGELGRREKIVGLIAAREHVGLATSIETIQAREAITATRDEIARLNGEIAQRRHQIAALLGRDPGFAEDITPPKLKKITDPTPLSAIPVNLLGLRPDVAASRAAVDAAAHDIGVARAAFYPDVNLVALAGVQSIGLTSLLRIGSIAAGAGPTFSLPIFDGGRLRADLRGKTANYDLCIALYEGVLTEALRQVADGITSLAAAHARQDEAHAAVAHRSHILNLDHLREQQGISNAIQRLSTETALLLAKRRAAEIDGRVAVEQVALIQALGGAWAPS